MNSQPTIDVMRSTAQTLRSGDVRDQLRALQTLQDATDAAKAVLLTELEATRDYELDGASTINTWVRNQLRLNAGTATALIKNVVALRELPSVAEAAATGQISAAHVRVLVYGLAHVGLAKMREFEDVFVAVALESDPGELFEAVKHLKDVTHPEDLDDAWEKGMDKEDFQVNAVPDGWHVSGFLNTVTGAKLKKVPDSVSAPRDAEDTRTGSQRRVQGLDDLLSAILGNGLPSDKGVKPHMSVFVDAETLQAAADHVKESNENPGFIPEPTPPVEPATLAGHGAIGPNLLMYFMCVSDFTAFLVKTSGNAQAQILNAGRLRYQPNQLQRRSVIARHPGRPSQRPWAERSEAGARAKPDSDGVAGAASAASRAPHHLPQSRLTTRVRRPTGTTTSGDRVNPGRLACDPRPSPSPMPDDILTDSFVVCRHGRCDPRA